MKQKSIQKTVDAYAGLTDKQRIVLLLKDKLESIKNKIEKLENELR